MVYDTRQLKPRDGGLVCNGMRAAWACSTQAMQGLNMAAVKLQGFEARDAVVEDEDAQLICAWAEEMVCKHKFNVGYGLQGERSVRAFMVLTKDIYAKHVEEEGGLVENYELTPSAWRPAVRGQRKAVGGGPHDVEAALKRAAVALGVGCGKEGDEEMPLLELLVQEPGLQPPGDWHGDVLSVWPSLGAIAVLSERAVPTYFPDVTRDWGAGRECIVSTAAGTGKKRLHAGVRGAGQPDGRNGVPQGAPAPLGASASVGLEQGGGSSGRHERGGR